MPLTLYSSVWSVTRDGNRAARELFRSHYSYRAYADGRDPKLFVGPGEKMVLKTRDNRALFVWRKFIDDAIPRQEGVNCAVFRNESCLQSSELILQAEMFARQRWPTERFYTYVNDTMIKSVNPGCCFIKAGWRRLKSDTGEWVRTKSGKLIMEKCYQ